MDIVVREYAKRLRSSCEVVVYHNSLESRAREVIHDDVVYRRVAKLPDRLVVRGLAEERRLGRSLGRQVERRPVQVSNFYYGWYAAAVARDSRRRGCDVVHVYIYDSLLPVLRRLNPHARLVLHMHDSSQALWDRRLVGRRLALADLIVGNSGYITDEVRRRFPEVADRCRAVLNAVDVHRFMPAVGDGAPQSTLRLLFVGRLSPEKGVHTLVRAFNTVVESGGDVTLELVGPSDLAPIEFVDPVNEDRHFDDVRRFFGSPRAFHDYLLGQLSPAARSRVTVAGEVPHAELPQRLRESDVLVFPSVWNEPFGLPAIEGMASGLPVVATRGGAFPEIVDDGRTGLLVERGDSNQLASALLRLVQNRELRREMGRRGRERACRLFTWDRYVTDWLRLYGEVTGSIDATRSRLDVELLERVGVTEPAPGRKPTLRGGRLSEE